MKKKLFVLNLLAIATTISLSGCSFLKDIINDVSGDESGDTSKLDDKTQTDEDKVITLKASFKTVQYEDRITSFQLNDRFIKPKILIEDVAGNIVYATEYAVFKDVDMSTVSPEGGTPVEYSIKYEYTDNNGGKRRGNIKNTYYISVKNRNDIHIDPTDSTIKTIEITDVCTHFMQGSEFIKPKVWSIDLDNSKVEITDLCLFEGNDTSSYGYKNVKIIYNDHSLEYEIIVHNKEEEALFPFYKNSFRLNLQTSLLVPGQSQTVFFIHYDSDGSKTEYGFGKETYIPDIVYSTSDDTIATINEDGIITAKSVGSVFIYAKKGSDSYRIKVDVEAKQLMSLEVQNMRSTYYSGYDVNVAGNFIATYQNGFQELVTPEFDLSKVNKDVPGEYDIDITYSINGVTKTLKETITIVDSSLVKVEKTELDYNIDDYDINSSVAVTGLPHKGTLKSLIIPIKFTDSDNYITNYSNVVSDINDVFFGDEDDITWRSVKTYYEEESHGQISFTGKVSDIYNAPKSSDNYLNNTTIGELKADVVEWYFENNPTEDRKSYDTNHDGFIDGLNLVYLYPDRSNLPANKREQYNEYWAMVRSQRLQVPNVNKPVSDRFFWSSYDFIYSDEDIALERTGKSNAHAGGDKIGVTARTFIHETGHMFGLNDYYSYSSDNYFAGHANMQTLNLMGHDPYSLLLYGWADPYIPEVDCRITIGDFQKTHDVILLTPQWNLDNSPYDEYFLLDLFVPDSGLNYYDAKVRKPVYRSSEENLDVTGVRIWHIDSRLATANDNYNTITTNPTIGGIVSQICDNSPALVNNDYLLQYDDFMELQLVRNKIGYDYKDATYVLKDEYFLSGDKFDMETFSSQFVNGNKMDSGLDLGWSVEIEGIYYDETNGYTADIILKKI